jgi:hypothetical protein
MPMVEQSSSGVGRRSIWGRDVDSADRFVCGKHDIGLPERKQRSHVGSRDGREHYVFTTLRFNQPRRVRAGVAEYVS